LRMFFVQLRIAFNTARFKDMIVGTGPDTTLDLSAINEVLPLSPEDYPQPRNKLYW